MKKITLLLLSICILFSCQQTRRSYPKVFNPDALEVLVFEIDVTKDTTLTLSSGLMFDIPKGSITLTDGTVARLKVRDAMATENMMKAGLVTRSNGKALSSGGMFSLEIDAKNAKIAKPIGVKVPTENMQKGMNVFTGELDADGNMNWVQPKAIEMQAPSGSALFKKNCAECHKIAPEPVEESIAYIPLSYEYKRYEKQWLLELIQGEFSDEGSYADYFCSMSRWNSRKQHGSINPTNNQRPRALLIQDDLDTLYTEPDPIELRKTHIQNMDMIPIDKIDLTDAEIFAIYDFIEKESERLKLPIPKHNAAACKQACSELRKQHDGLLNRLQMLDDIKTKQIKKQQIKKEVAEAAWNELNSKSAVNIDKTPRNNTIIKPGNIKFPPTPPVETYVPTPPGKRTPSYYTFDIKAPGWFNVDLLLKKGNYPECQLLVRCEGEFKANVDIFLVIPSIKVFTQAGKEGDTGLYSFAEKGIMAMPKGSLAWVYAVGEENSNFYLAMQAFEIDAKNEITLTPEASTQAKIKKSLKMMSDDLSMTIEDSGRKKAEKVQAEVNKMQLKIDKTQSQMEEVKSKMQELEKLGNMPETCVCPCTLRRYSEQ